MRLRVAVVVAISVVLCMPLSWADSWVPPRTKQYISEEGTSRAIIVPRALAGSFEYFRDKADGKASAGQRADSNIRQPFARMSRRTAEGRWITLWQQSLVNDVAPVHALVANGGKYLITFDNWHHRGYGPDAVAIYDARGRLVRKYALIDFLPISFIETLKTSTSSIHWGAGHFLTDNDETLILRVAEPSFGFDDEQGLAISVRIRLSDGMITPPAGRAWERALRKSRTVRLQQEAYARKACKERGGGWCKR
jgi:hypothetical protein